MTQNERWDRNNRLAGLRRFGVAITLLNVVGRLWLGFEQSWAQLLVAVVTAYTLESLLEWTSAWAEQRPTRFGRSPTELVDFLLSAHIAALAVSMLLYANDRLWPIAFAVAAAIGSKAVFRVPAGKGTRHFFNPSNFGITLTLLLFPWVGIAPPYHFTENLSGIGDWLLPGLIIASGTFLNARFTHRLPLIGAWLSAFAAQAAIRSTLFGSPLLPALLPMTGVAFILFTFYMVTDPATTPNDIRGQVAFGVAIATIYGLLLFAHVVFGLFFALTIICALRGGWLYAPTLARRRTAPKVAMQTPAVIGRSEV